MEVNTQHHAPAILPPEKNPLPSDQEARWSPRSYGELNPGAQSKFHTGDLQTLGANLQNLVTRDLYTPATSLQQNTTQQKAELNCNAVHKFTPHTSAVKGSSLLERDAVSLDE
jgi:hypothetical protein